MHINTSVSHVHTQPLAHRHAERLDFCDLIAELDFLVIGPFCVSSHCLCAAAAILKYKCWDSASHSSLYLQTVINSHMRLFVVAVQSKSYFSICYRYSLLCYLPSCAMACHLFCRCKIDAVFLLVTLGDYDVPSLNSRYASKLCCSKHFLFLSTATKENILCIFTSWLTFIINNI